VQVCEGKPVGMQYFLAPQCITQRSGSVLENSPSSIRIARLGFDD
jgi:hypothetical protein